VDHFKKTDQLVTTITITTTIMVTERELHGGPRIGAKEERLLSEAVR
jgi:hypothetical protein